jgi:hypothetical protein
MEDKSEQPLPPLELKNNSPEWQSKYAIKKAKSKADACWEGIADVDWLDLEFYIEKSRRNQDKESLDTAVRIMERLRLQILERKGKSK